GPTSYTGSAGAVFTGAYVTTNTVTVTIGGVVATVLWAGLVGAGLYQINIRVPASVADGDQAVVAMVGGLSSQSGALLKVAASAKLSAQSVVGSRLTRFLAAGPGKALLPTGGHSPATMEQAL